MADFEARLRELIDQMHAADLVLTVDEESMTMTVGRREPPDA